MVKEQSVKGEGIPNLIAELVKKAKVERLKGKAKCTVKADVSSDQDDDEEEIDEVKMDDSSNNTDGEDDDIDVELDDEDVDKVLPGFIDEMIAKKRKRLLALVKDDVDLKDLVKEFLDTKEMSKDLKDVLESLKPSSRTAEIQMLLNQIQLENARLTRNPSKFKT